MINFVVLSGNLVKDPQKMANKENDGFWCTFTLAASESGEKTSYFNCKAYKASAEYLCKYCKKGDKIIIDGRLVQDTYTTRDGQNRSEVRVITNHVIGFSKGDSQPQAVAKSKPTETVLPDDDPAVPF